MDGKKRTMSLTYFLIISRPEKIVHLINNLNNNMYFYTRRNIILDTLNPIIRSTNFVQGNQEPPTHSSKSSWPRTQLYFKMDEAAMPMDKWWTNRVRSCNCNHYINNKLDKVVAGFGEWINRMRPEMFCEHHHLYGHLIPGRILSTM